MLYAKKRITVMRCNECIYMYMPMHTIYARIMAVIVNYILHIMYVSCAHMHSSTGMTEYIRHWMPFIVD